jgi:lysophospholipase L1-like esterase
VPIYKLGNLTAKKYLGKTGLILFGIIIGLLISEVCLRLGGNLLPEGWRYRAGLARFEAQMYDVYVSDPYLWQKSVPGINRLITGHPDFTFQVQTDSLGYEGIGFRDDGLDQPPLTVALGDSFTWGDGINNDKIWVEVLEAKSGLDIINLGMSGYGSQQRLRMLKTYGLPFQPKLVLWSFFPNDFDDDGHFAWREETGRLARQAESPTPPTWTETLDRSMRNYSAAYTWLVSPFEEPEDDEEYERLYYTDRTLDLTFVLDPYWQERLNPTDKYVAPGVNLTHQALAEAQALAVQADARLVVLLFPFKEQVYWPIVSTLIDDPAAYEVNWPINDMKAWCEAHQVPYLDLTPIFMEHAANGEQLYFRYDAHWNEAGHALAAQAIQQYLAKNNPYFAYVEQ